MIETTFRRRPFSYGRNVVEAVSAEEGVLTIKRPSWEYENSKSNTINVKAKLTAGAVTKYSGFAQEDFFNVNWDNVKVINGETYAVKNVAKSLGFRWNGAKKQWEK